MSNLKMNKNFPDNLLLKVFEDEALIAQNKSNPDYKMSAMYVLTSLPFDSLHTDVLIEHFCECINYIEIGARHSLSIEEVGATVKKAIELLRSPIIAPHLLYGIKQMSQFTQERGYYEGYKCGNHSLYSKNKLRKLCVAARTPGFCNGPKIEVFGLEFPREVFAFPVKRLRIPEYIIEHLEANSIYSIGEFLYYKLYGSHFCEKKVSLSLHSRYITILIGAIESFRKDYPESIQRWAVLNGNEKIQHIHAHMCSYPQNLFQGLYGVDSERRDLEAAMEYVLWDVAKNHEKEARIIRAYYKELESPESIAAKMNTSEEVIVELLKKGLDIMRSSTSSRMLLSGIRETIDEIRNRGYTAGYEKGVSDSRTEFYTRSKNFHLKSHLGYSRYMKIEYLDLSEQVLELLKKANVSTVWDVIQNLRMLSDTCGNDGTIIEPLCDKLSAFGFEFVDPTKEG